MNGFERRAERIKEKIRGTVLKMLQTWEPKKIRVADIAAEAGVSQVTIYNYFGSKEGLLRETFRDYINRSLEEFEKFIDGQPSMKEIVEYCIFYDKQAFRMFAPAVVKQILIDDSEISGDLDRAYQRTLPLVERMIEEGRQRGEISAQVSTSTIITFIGIMQTQSLNFLEQAQNSGNLDAFLQEVLHLFFYGLCGAEPKTEGTQEKGKGTDQ